jgi:hypothetical protein
MVCYLAPSTTFYRGYNYNNMKKKEAPLKNLYVVVFVNIEACGVLAFISQFSIACMPFAFRYAVFLIEFIIY